MLKKSAQLFSRVADAFDSDNPLMINMYGGYASEDRFYLKGRVLENEGIFLDENQSRIRTLIDNFKRFESDEIPGARVKVKVRDRVFEVFTDNEGYFEIDEKWNSPLSPKENRWIDVHAQLVDTVGVASEAIAAKGELFFPSRNADFGVISDVDDTVLQTHATSRFKLKMMYVSFFKDPYERLPMDNVDKLYKELEKGKNGKRENPIFYVSNSPWNLFDNISTFLEVNKFPKGPVLLRDAGIHLLKHSDLTWGHKMQSISHILKTYSDLPFIMLGDTASKDADHYLDLAKEFEGRIKAIYIRHTRNTANALRVADLVESRTDVNIVLVRNTDEIREHAIIHGLIK